MVESDKKPVPASILKQPNPAAGKRQRAPMIKQTVSKHNIIYFLVRITRKYITCVEITQNCPFLFLVGKKFEHLQRD